MGTAGSPTLALPTVAEVLALPPLAAGEPEVLAGTANLDRRVRWAHVSEIAEIAGLLHGGELLLTTGVALPDDRAELAAFVGALDDAGAAGLVVELGRRYQRTLPPTLVRAAQERGLPLVALRREVRFVAVTEAVHALVADARLRELRASEEVHQTFTELSVEGAEPVEVVRQAARMSGRAVVLENLAHQVLAYDAAGGDPRELLDGWETRSRAVDPSQRTGYDERSGWLVTVVGARGHDWGRLVLVAGAPPPPRDVMLVERAASTLALNRLVERDRESLERQTHRSLLSGILSHSWPASEVALRAGALGVPLEGRRLVGVVLRPAPLPGEAVLEAEQRARDLTETAAAAVRTARVPALVGSIDDVGVGVLLSLGPQMRVDDMLDSLAAALHAPDDSVMAVGSLVEQIADVRRSFLEAAHVADAAPRSTALPFHRLEDVRLRGLLHLLRDDARLQTYVERELSPLLRYDAEHGTDLTGLLRIYLDEGRNKSAAASAAHLSRPAFYERLHRVERVLGADLDDAEGCLSLHVALTALDALRRA
ncbi:MAG TPA: PucR family transcriptional regulator ligand-binding domain-containing protein [Actinomycetes bacterium]